MVSPSLRSSKHSNVISNWNGLKYGEGLSSTVTLHIFTLAIVFVRFKQKFKRRLTFIVSHELP